MIAPANAEEKGAKFIITSDCVISVEVKKSRVSDTLDVVFSLNEDAGKKLLDLSKRYISRKLTILDGNNRIISEAIVYGVFSSVFMVSGIQSEKAALRISKSVMASTGECGQRK